MPPLMAIIGGNADPLKRELAAVQRMAQQAGVNLQRGLAGGGGHGGTSGIVSETLVLIRELSRGNFTRVPGSITILAQRMGILKLIIKDTADGANILADAWAKEAEKAGLAALASTRKAQASTVALYALGGETDANLAAAVADEEKAAADIMVAKATQTKAIASSEAAAAANAEAGATRAAVGPMGIALGIIVAIGAGAYAASKLVKYLTDELSGLKPADFQPDYIAKHLQKANQPAELQKDINREIQKTVDLYNSASAAAARVSEATKTHFDHQRKINELNKERDLAGVKDPATRAKIEAEYAQKTINLRKQEQNQELANMYQEQFGLKQEGTIKQQQANAIDVNSKEHDDNLTRQRKAEADAAQKYLDDVEKSKNNKFTQRNIMRAYNAVALSGVSGNDLDAAEKANRTEAGRRLQAYRDQVDKSAANDELRKRKEELGKTAGQSLSQATVLGLKIGDTQKANAREIADTTAEAQARAAAEAAKDRAKESHAANLDITGNQHIGARIGGPQLEQLNVSKASLNELKSIRTHITRGGGGGFNSRKF